MMKKTLPPFCVLLSAICASAHAAATAWGSDVVGLVQYATDNSIAARRDAAKPGVLLATELRDGGENQVAALTIGSPDSSRIRVIDRYALHRSPLERVEFPNYYIELGEGASLVSANSVNVFRSFTVPGVGQSPATVTYTRTFRIVPLGGYRLMSAQLAKANAEAAGTPSPAEALCEISTDYMDDGSVTVSASVRSAMETYVYSCDVVIDSLLGSPMAENTVRDDLTLSDYFFRDGYGDTSLGNLRAWVHGAYDRYKANRWTDFAAAGTVNLAANRVRFSGASDLRTESTAATNDTITIRQNGKIVLRSVAAANATNGTFRIVGIDFNSSDAYDYIYTDTTVSDPPYAIVCYNLAEADWERPDGQTTTASTWKGEAAWRIAVPKTPSAASKFFKAVSQGAETAAYIYTEAVVYARGGIALQDSSGGWWKLAVDTSGNLSTSAISDVPEGIPQ